MLLGSALYITTALLVITHKFRVMGIMYLQLWEIGLISCLLLWLYQIALTKKTNFQFDSLNIVIFIFLLINIFSSIRLPEVAGKFMEGGLWQNARTIEPVVFYIILNDHLTSKKNIISFLYCLLIVLFAEASLGIVQSLGNIDWPSMPDVNLIEGMPRSYSYYFLGFGNPLVYPAHGTFEHFNAFGAYIATLIPLLICLASSRTIMKDKFTWPLVALSIAGLCLAYSRGALLSCITGLSLMFFIVKRKNPATLIVSSMLIIFALVAVTIVVLSRGYQETLNYDVRADIWKTALQVIFYDPVNFILGTGSGTYVYWTQYEYKGHFYSPHNSYIFFWLETGLLGLISFLSIFMIFFTRSLKTFFLERDHLSRIIAMAMIGIIPCYLIACFFSSLANELHNKAFFLIFIVLLNAARRNADNADCKKIVNTCPQS